MRRLGIIGGSLIGAVAIHAMLVACGTLPTGDAGHDAGVDVAAHDDALDAIMDTARDVANDVLDAETPDAMAQDGGATCGCPEAPSTTFRGTATIGGAPAAILADYSTATLTGTPTFDGTARAIRWDTNVEFRAGVSNDRLFGSCQFFGAQTGMPMATNDAACTFNHVRGTQIDRHMIVASDITITAVSDTGADVRIAFTEGTGANAFSVDLTIHHTRPAGGLTTPPRAYTP